MTLEQIVRALAGGLMVGVAAGAVLLLNGRVAGISGMISSLVGPRRADAGWQAMFLLGLVVSGVLLSIADPGALPGAARISRPLMLVSGLLVGFGARLGGGCTSGHSLCGTGRLSLRSLVATSLFVLTGAVSVWALRHWQGGL
jgi:hypothetical protein